MIDVLKKFIYRLISLIVLSVIILALWLTQPLLGPFRSDLVCEAVDEARLRQSVQFLIEQVGTRNYEDSATLEVAASYIEAQFKQTGAVVSSQRFQVGLEWFRNIVAQFGPVAKPAIIVGAHYDTEASTPGADDNASGVAGLLELARLLGQQPPKNSVELVAYTLEEPPNFDSENMGSWQHANRLAHDQASPKIIVVLEMIGYFDDHPGSQAYPIPGLSYLYPQRGDFIGIAGDLSSPLLVRRVKDAMRNCSRIPVYSINAPAWVPGVALSDHSSYWLYEFPALMVTDTAYLRNPHYHQALDLPDTLNYANMKQVVQGVMAAIRAFDTVDPAF